MAGYPWDLNDLREMRTQIEAARGTLHDMAWVVGPDGADHLSSIEDESGSLAWERHPSSLLGLPVTVRGDIEGMSIYLMDSLPIPADPDA